MLHPVPEVSCGGHLPHHDREASQHRAIVASSGSIQLQQVVQVAAQQVGLSGLQVAAFFHGAPNLLWDLQEQFDLSGYGVELFLALLLALQLPHDRDTLNEQ